MNNDNTSRFISIFALVVAVLSCLASWWGTISTVNKNNAELEFRSILSWQQSLVYSLIDKGTKNKPTGMTFDEIKDKYVAAGLTEPKLKISKDKLQEEELRLVLLSLMESKLIYQTLLDTYVTGKTQQLYGVEKTFEVNRGIGSILRILSTRGGELTVAGMEEAVTKDTNITKEDYHTAVNQLIASNAVTLDEAGKLWSVSNPNPKKKDK
jgi:hypothetical protein